MVVEDAHVSYRVYASGKKLSVRDTVFGLNALRGGRGLQSVHALRGVSFSAHEGESIGVVGHNGSGKSTLFRAMTGLVPTSQGAIWAADRPVLLGVNAALLPDLSGENNIKLGLLAMGFTAEEAAERVPEIAEFAELNEFLYHPMRTYSSGMGARLRFAIASAKAHSILLIDEALSVGDRRFKRKSERRIRELRDTAGLVMLVSHSNGSILDTCERVLWIHKGELRADGPAQDVVDEYVKWTKNPNSTAVGAASTKPVSSKSSAADGGPGDGESRPDVVERRGRRSRLVHAKQKRRLIAAISTAAAIVIAAGAGVAFAIAANLPDRAIAPLVLRTQSARPTDSSSPPLVRTFGTTTPEVVCTAAEGNVEAWFSWDVEDAASIALSMGASGSGASEPVASGLPLTVTDQQIPFPCSSESVDYTITAENAAGARVSSVVTVARRLEVPEPRRNPVPSRPQQPAQPQDPAPEEPQQPPAEDPVPVPSDPATDDPSQEPNPSQPPSPDDGDESEQQEDGTGDGLVE